MTSRSGDLYDEATALLDRAAFVDPAIHALELRRIFATSWLFVGPANWVERPGDWMTTRMGDVPVVVWRDHAGIPRAFVNLCPRCDRLPCIGARGHASRLGCARHGTAGDGDSDLTPLPGLDIHGGLVFACLDAAALPFGDWLGPFARLLDAALDGVGGSVEAAGNASLPWSFEGNWKLAVERFCGDIDGGQFAHAATDEAMGVSPPTTRRAGTQVAVGPGAATIGADGEAGRGRTVPMGFALFPNLSFDAATASLHVWHPVGPSRTDVDTYCLVARDAAAETREAALRATRFAWGAAGLRSQDLVGAWRSITASSAGLHARRVPLTLRAGRDAERVDAAGCFGPLLGESNQRAFYGWWQTRLRAANERPTLATPLRVGGERASAAAG